VTWRRIRWALLALVVLVPVARAIQLFLAGSGSSLLVGMVFEPSALPDLAYIRDAYTSVLQEEGIPHEWVSTRELSLLSGSDAARRYRALVFPDGLAQSMPVELEDRVGEYLEAGGDVAVVYDPGVREPGGAFRAGGLLADLVGVEYLRYRQDPEAAYIEGNVHFVGPGTARRWGIPSGKLYRGSVVGGYAYGSLTYPMANARATADDIELLAVSEGVPVLSLRNVGPGSALWVNLPLGYLKAYSDDMPLRATLRSFLFEIARIPHLVSSPRGVGGLVIDWHIDSAIEWEGVPALIRNRLVRDDLRMQFDITAGPDRDAEGDGLGFDACGRGDEVARRLLRYGELGSHGGWAHNLFSERLADGEIGPEAAFELVERNDGCVASISGEPVRGYSAPNGVHPQPLMTRVLERAGIIGYYYTGDTGSPPNRTFFDAQMVSPSVWAFPVMPNGVLASMGEMVKEGLGPREIERWLVDTLDYVVAERTIRLVYSHPYDLFTKPSGRPLPDAYRRAFGRFLSRVEALQSRGELTVATMDGYVAFLDRLVSTQSAFEIDEDELVVTLQNPSGLSDLTVALPPGLVEDGSPTPDGTAEVASGPGEGRLFTVTSNATVVEMRLPLA